MYALLKKDFIKSKNVVIFLNIIVALIIVLLCNTANIDGIIMMYVFSTIFILIFTMKIVESDEARKHFDIFINSLPVKRDDIVLSKFIFYLITFVLSSLFLTGVLFILYKPNKSELNDIFFMKSIIFAIFAFVVGIIKWISFAKDFEFGVKYSALIMIGSVYIPIIILKIIKKFIPQNILNEASNFVFSIMPKGMALNLFIYLIGIFIYALFMVKSIKGYRKKDLV